MVDEVDPVGPGGEASAPGLEERVARLEVELAALRRQVAAGTVVAAPAASAMPELREAAEVRTVTASPAPPPWPTAAAIPEAGLTQDMRRLVSGSWASTAHAKAAREVGESRDSLESQLGSKVFNWIAILLLLIGTAYFLKLAIDRGWIVPSPTGRVLIGLVAGAGLVLWSERFRAKGFAAFSYSLKALGSGVLYLSLWAAFQLYHLMPAGVALGLMVLVTAWNGYMAWAQDSQLLAAYALAGGFGTPLLLSTGGDHEIFLFSYLLAIDVATVALVRLRPWAKLLLGAFPLTVAFFVAWYAEHYAADALGVTAIYIVLFSVTFGSVALGRARAGGSLPRATLLKEILLPLATAAFAALAGYFVLQDAGHHDWLPWLMLALAAVYLGVMRAPQTRTASAIHLSLAVVLLTIAIPLKASGHWITVSWLVEGLALLWVAARLEQADEDAGADEGEAYAAGTLKVLASGALLLGFCGVAAYSISSGFAAMTAVWNADTGTELTGVAVFAAVVWVGLRAAGAARGRDAGWVRVGFFGLLAIDAIAVLMAVREVGTSWDSDGGGAQHVPLASADFWTAAMGLVVFAGVVAVSLRLARARAGEDFWTVCAAGSTIAFNAIAVLTGVREIAAVWEGSSSAGADAALKEALAISAYLMVYGAALLAAGFWRRSGFLRWQALGLLVFTIFKAFLHDMRDLSQGYRVASFLGLGALLMAISFAYQKDWLGLRVAAASGDASGDGVASAGPEAER